MSKSFDQQIIESAKKYRPEPALNWNDIELRLERHQKSRVRRLYVRIISAAAVFILIAAFAVNQWITSPAQQNSLFASADSISELNAQSSYYGTRYPIEDLYRAYYKAGVLQEEDASLKGWR